MAYHLTVLQYFEAIQKEYLIADFRRKIYFGVKDRKYYERLMNYKKEKIEKISDRNKLNNIFNDDDILHKITSLVFNGRGYPVFKMSEKDWENYFAVGSNFSYCGRAYTLILPPSSDFLFLEDVHNPSNQITVKKEDCCRIL